MAGVCGTRKQTRKKVERSEEPEGVSSVSRNSGKTTALMTAVELISCGHSDLSAVKHIVNVHSLSLEQAQAVLEKAYNQIHCSHEERPVKQKLSIAVEQRSRIAAKAYDNDDMRVALSALEQRDKLLGLHDPGTFEQSSACSTLLALIQKSISTENSEI